MEVTITFELNDVALENKFSKAIGEAIDPSRIKGAVNDAVVAAIEDLVEDPDILSEAISEPLSKALKKFVFEKLK